MSVLDNLKQYNNKHRLFVDGYKYENRIIT